MGFWIEEGPKKDCYYYTEDEIQVIAGDRVILGSNGRHSDRVTDARLDRIGYRWAVKQLGLYWNTTAYKIICERLNGGK